MSATYETQIFSCNWIYIFLDAALKNNDKKGLITMEINSFFNMPWNIKLNF